MTKFKKGDLIKYNGQFVIIKKVIAQDINRCVLETSTGTTYNVKTENIILVKPSEFLSFNQYVKALFKKYVCEDKNCTNWKACAVDNFSDCTKNKYFLD